MSIMSKTTRLVLAIVFLIAVCLGGVYLFTFSQHHGATTISQSPPKVHGLMLTTPRMLPPFSLTTDRNKPFTEARLKGHWSFMFFGFTHCPKVCPTTMAAMNKMYQRLAQSLPKSQLPQVIMVSVDPNRDTVTRMHDYVTTFNPNFIGLTGSMPVLKSMQHSMHVFAEKIATHTAHQQHYDMRHTAAVMVIGPKGQLRGFLSYPQKPDEMIADYKAIIKAYPNA